VNSRPLLWRGLGAALALAATTTPAATPRGFAPDQSGFFLGGGAIVPVFVHENRYDPLPAWIGPDAGLSGSTQPFRIPGKAGFFWNLTRIEFQAYGRIVLNAASTWTSVSPGGSGEAAYRSYGAGFQTSYFPLATAGVRVGFAASAELVLEKLNLRFRPDTGRTQIADLSATAKLVGVGPLVQIWLGDLWALEISSLYQFGLPGTWSLGQATDFLGGTRSAGALRNFLDGGAVPADFGGLLLEATLRLTF